MEIKYILTNMSKVVNHKTLLNLYYNSIYIILNLRH